VAAGVIALTSATRASAQQQGFALDRFNPSERGSDWFELESLDFRGHLRVAGGLVGEYAFRPLAIYNLDGTVKENLVQDSLVLHPGASLVLWNRLRVGLDLPVYAWQDGQSGAAGGVTYQSASENVGDVRLGADARIYGEYGGLFTLGGGVQLYLPTGSRADYTSDGVTRVEPRLMAAGKVSWFCYAAKLAFDYRGLQDQFAGTALGSEFLFAASAGVKTWHDRLLVGPEFFGSTVVTTGGAAVRNTPLELLVGGHLTVEKDWRLGAAIGPGLSRAYGEPELRFVMSAEWAPGFEPPPPPPPEPPPAPKAAPPPDRDSDGIIDSEDACPDQPGPKTDDPKTNGCPDRDKDGIIDKIDACPDDPGPKTDDPATTGCPDRDKDGVPDKVDACPDVPGVKTDDPKTNGCPPDRDKDGIVDPVDACPDVPGPPNEDPKKNGCPLARIEQGEVKIRDQIKFRFNSAEVDPASDPILEAVVKVMTDHPEIVRVRVEGHTDNKGGPAYNLNLSQRRAASVMKWLAGHGIDKKRLYSQGLGLTKPIDDNATEDGRRNNRRVEFHIEDSGKTAPPK
jgi:outer membrane protein OmpA-like peptidoglycan-associated protein